MAVGLLIVGGHFLLTGSHAGIVLGVLPPFGLEVSYDKHLHRSHH